MFLFLGHSCFCSKDLLYTSALDGTIQVWRIPIQQQQSHERGYNEGIDTSGGKGQSGTFQCPKSIDDYENQIYNDESAMHVFTLRRKRSVYVKSMASNDVDDDDPCWTS